MKNKKIIGALFILTIAIFLTLRFQGDTLVTPSAPKGIVSLEITTSGADTEAIRKEWSGAVRSSFYINMAIDYIFLFVYGAFFFLACKYFANLQRRYRKIGAWAAWAGLVAAALDAMENFLMILSVSSGGNNARAIATACTATLKFSLIAFAAFYVIFSGLFYRRVARPGTF